jgi:DNA-binding transcriptional ArsR family regulator
VTTYATDVWHALSDPTRRLIFERLADQPQAVVDLARELPVSRPAVSQHLKVLKNAGLVVGRAEGTRRIYQVSPGGIDALRVELERYWTKALASFKEGVEQTARRSD